MVNNNIKTIVIILFLSFIILNPVVVKADSVTQTRYFDSELNPNDITASYFAFFENMIGTTYKSAETQHATTNRALQIGIRVYQWFLNSSSIELTSGIPVAVVEIPYTTTTNITAIYNGTWTAPLTNLSRTDSLQINVLYRRKVLSIWLSWNIWTNVSWGATQYLSEPLGMDKIINETWTVNYWVKSWKIGTIYWWSFYFGDSVYNSSITNMVFDNGLTTEMTETYQIIGLISLCIATACLGLFVARKKRL